MHRCKRQEDLLEWLQGRVAKYVGQDTAAIRSDVELSNLGLDSIRIVELAADLVAHVAVDIDPEWMINQPSLLAVVQVVLERRRNAT